MHARLWREALAEQGVIVTRNPASPRTWTDSSRPSADSEVLSAFLEACRGIKEAIYNENAGLFR